MVPLPARYSSLKVERVAVSLTSEERDMLAGENGPAVAMAMRIVVGTANMLGAERLVEIASVHVDGCLYHGDSGTLFVEHLRDNRGKVAVPTTLNVGSLDLIHAGRVRLPEAQRVMAKLMMDAYVALGCQPTWTCSPYQAGHRPSLGQNVAWGESNAVVFCNSVLGARTNRYGDYLDISAALTGRAPYTGLHRPENRVASIHVDASGLDPKLTAEESVYPVIGTWLGLEVGSDVAVLSGLPASISEDRLKALGAAAASRGSVGLFHIVGITPEAPDLDAALGGREPVRTIRLTASMLDEARRSLSTTQLRAGEPIGAVAVGSPHFSRDEFQSLLKLLRRRHCRVPFYACTGRHVIRLLQQDGSFDKLQNAGVTIVADTCIVVTPILPDAKGVLVTNSGKFAHYTNSNTGWNVLFASLDDCVECAVSGRFVRNEALWN